MVEYRKSLWVALTNPLTLALAIIVESILSLASQGLRGLLGGLNLAQGLREVLGGLNLAKYYDVMLEHFGDINPDTKVMVIYVISTMVIHWWKHRDKYKKNKKVKALVGILSIGVINFILIYAMKKYSYAAGEPDTGSQALIALVGLIIMSSLAGVFSDLVWQELFVSRGYLGESARYNI